MNWLRFMRDAFEPAARTGTDHPPPPEAAGAVPREESR